MTAHAVQRGSGRRPRLLAAVALVVLTAAACGDGDAEIAGPRVRNTGPSGPTEGGPLDIPTTQPPEVATPTTLVPPVLEGIAQAVAVDLETCKLTVTLSNETVGFAFDSADLSDEGRHALELVATDIADTRRVVVEGHSSAEGDHDYNVELSLRRAHAVETILVPLLPKASFRSIGKGPDEPISVTGDSEEDRARNRRVEITASVEREECVPASQLAK